MRKKKEEYKISVAKLVKNKNRIEKYVECEKVSEKGFVIKGWCIYQNKVDIIVKDEKKEYFASKNKKKKRELMFLTNIRNARKRMYMALRLYTKEMYRKLFMFIWKKEIKAQNMV